MKKYQSRFGIVGVGAITGFDLPAKTLTVEGVMVVPSASFWGRFTPQRTTVIPAPPAEEGEEQADDTYLNELDYTVGYYVLTESGHDRFIYPADLGAFTPVGS